MIVFLSLKLAQDLKTELKNTLVTWKWNTIYNACCTYKDIHYSLVFGLGGVSSIHN